MKRLTAWVGGTGPARHWIGPHGNIAVRTTACGDARCGRVAWIDRAARGEAAEGGTPFAPDLGRRFASRIEPLSADRLRVEGCVLGGPIRRRIDRLPAGA